MQVVHRRYVITNLDVTHSAQDMAAISSAATSTATSIQNLRTLLSGTDANPTEFTANPTEFTACQIEVPVLDSATSHTMCREAQELAGWHPAQVAIRLANQTTTRAIGAGTALLQTCSRLITTPDALHEAGLRLTLFGVSQLAK
jgi:hypothetical protein